MKKSKTKRLYAILQHIIIVLCLFAIIATVSILVWVVTTMQELMAAPACTYKEPIPEVTTEVQDVNSQNCLYEEHTPNHNINEDNVVVDLPLEAFTTPPETAPQKMYEIGDVEDNISKWCLANENSEAVTLWKLTDEQGCLFIALKNRNDEVLVTFKYEGIDANPTTGWELCNYFFEESKVCDLIDYSFTAYREVGGKNPENVQAQVVVLINRQNCNIYDNTIRGVITESGQYACSKSVVNRWLKDDNYLEKEDLERCFRQTLLVLVGEGLNDVPTDVVYAATKPQGSGIWKVIGKTYYCYL